MSEQASHEEVRDLLERGRTCRKSGYASASFPYFLRAARLAPDNDEIRDERQKTRDRIQKLLDVVDASEQDLARTSTSTEALLRLVHALTGLYREDEAVPMARQAVTVDPDDVEALFTLGNLLNPSDHYEEAVAVF